MSLSDEQRQFYEKSLEITRDEIKGLDREIEEELAKVKDRLMELQTARKASLQMYGAACTRLSIPNDLAEAEEGAAAEQSSV